MENIYDKDYAPFMEEALQSMVQMPIAGICIISRLKDGSVFTQYHNSTTMDKMIYAGVIQQDITMDVMNAYKKARNNQDEEKE